MKLYSYVVSRDYGFAPNPFYGVCTLATCKPLIRRTARAGDWIVGTGSRSRKNDREGHLVYVMQVAEEMTFDQYYNDVRFGLKKPNMFGSLKQAFGDNIYWRDRHGRWCQSNSHHSYDDGSPNQANVAHDTSTDRVLVGNTYAYWGCIGPKVPARFRDFLGYDICKRGRGYKCCFPCAMVDAFAAWFVALDQWGFRGAPLEWKGQRDS